MNEELKTRLTKYLDYLEEVMHKSTDFASEQVPETIRQLIEWEFYSGLLKGTVLLVASIVLAHIAWKTYKWIVRTGDKSDICLVVIFCSIASVVALIIGLSHFYDSAKCRIAPNLVVIEKLSDLVKGVQ